MLLLPLLHFIQFLNIFRFKINYLIFWYFYKIPQNFLAMSSMWKMLNQTCQLLTRSLSLESNFCSLLLFLLLWQRYCSYSIDHLFELIAHNCSQFLSIYCICRPCQNLYCVISPIQLSQIC